MNYSTAIFLVNSDVRAVSVSYDRDQVTGNGIGPFTIFKTMDKNLEVGDYVVVPTNTRHQMTVVRIEEVDLEIDLDSGTQLQWLVGNVDTGPYERTVAAEAQAIAVMKSAEKRRRQEELREKMLADNPELSKLGEVTVAVALPAPN